MAQFLLVGKEVMDVLAKEIQMIYTLQQSYLLCKVIQYTLSLLCAFTVVDNGNVQMFLRHLAVLYSIG